MKKKRIGLFMIPIKFNPNISTYNDYIDFAVAAEDHGYTDIYIGEHLTDQVENIQSSLVFASAVLAKTKRIYVNLSVLPLPHYDIKLLIKQLEDLYLLGNGRISIGFSQGALDNDLKYLGINPKDRGKIFASKLSELNYHLLKSNIILGENILPHMFSTLLSDFPFKAGCLAEAGYSALSSNFCNSDHLASHIKCFLSGSKSSPQSVLPDKVKWYIGVNLIPKTLSEESENIIKDSLFYIYNKLAKCNKTNIMTSNIKCDHLDESDLKSLLFNLLCSSTLSPSIKTISEKCDIFSHYVINLFDCFDDYRYKQYILGIPKALNGKD